MVLRRIYIKSSPLIAPACTLFLSLLFMIHMHHEKGIAAEYIQLWSVLQRGSPPLSMRFTALVLPVICFLYAIQHVQMDVTCKNVNLLYRQTSLLACSLRSLSVLAGYVASFVTLEIVGAHIFGLIIDGFVPDVMMLCSQWIVRFFALLILLQIANTINLVLNPILVFSICSVGFAMVVLNVHTLLISSWRFDWNVVPLFRFLDLSDFFKSPGNYLYCLFYILQSIVLIFVFYRLLAQQDILGGKLDVS